MKATDAIVPREVVWPRRKLDPTAPVGWKYRDPDNIRSTSSSPEKTKEFTNYYRGRFNYLKWAPIIFLSALNRTKMPQLKKAIVAAYKERFREIDPNALDRLLKSAIRKTKPTIGKGTRKPYIKRIRQVGVNPPQFVIHLDKKSSLKMTYAAYLETRIREKFGFEGSPVKIWVEKV